MTTEELLAVLDLPRAKQLNWLPQNTDIKFKAALNGEENLADLAFRMRDEAVKADHNNWCDAKKVVWLHDDKYAEPFKKLAKEYNLKDSVNRTIQRREVYFANHAQPMHWIIAALIAKELSKEKENGKSTSAIRKTKSCFI